MSVERRMVAWYFADANCVRGDAVDKRSHKRSIAKEFKQLPDRARFPDYYDVIPEPMSLEVIKRKLDSNSFATPAAFFHDLHLIFLNAKHCELSSLLATRS